MPRKDKMGRAFEYRRASKEARWDKMSKLFPKLAKAIQVAAKEGGGDPAMNAKLRSMIAVAKAQNMPKNNIDAAIKRALGKDSTQIKTFHYEARGNKGSLYIIECMSDNPTRTVANVKAILNKNNATMLQNDSLSFMFEKKAVFYINKNENIKDLEELELELIDFGLLSLEERADELVLIAEDTAFKTLSDALDERGLELKQAAIEYLATQPIKLDDLSDHHKLLDKLEDDDDVHIVFTNVGEDYA